MNDDAVIDLLVVDDHPVVRKGIVDMLRPDRRMMVVGEAASGLEATALYRALRPHVVMMDLRMPRMGGVEAIEAIRSYDAAARVIIMTALDNQEDIYQGLKAGAHGYVLKDAPGDQLIDAVLMTMAGRRYLTPSVAAKLADHLDSDQLTLREKHILQLLSTGMPNKRIAKSAGITEGTVKFHVNKILAKLDCATRTEAVSFAMKRGLIQLP